MINYWVIWFLTELIKPDFGLIVKVKPNKKNQNGYERKYCPYCGSTIEKHYSLESCAEMFDCSVQFFRNLVRDRKIGYVKIGRLVRIPMEELNKISKYIPTLEEKVEELIKNG